MMRRSKVHPIPAGNQALLSKVYRSWQEVLVAGKDLSAQEQEIIKTSWQLLSQDLEGFGCQVLTRLEENSPEAFSAYTSEPPTSDITSEYSPSLSMSTSSGYSFLSDEQQQFQRQPCGVVAYRCHARRTMEAYGMVVFGLDDMDTIYPLLKSNGRRLARKGVEPRHMRALSVSLLGTVQSVFLSNWGFNYQTAWTALTAIVEFGYIAGMAMHQPSAPPKYLPITSSALPDFHSALASPSNSSCSMTSASSISSFDMSPLSMSSASFSSRSSASTSSDSQSDDTSPKLPARNPSWATRPPPVAWMASDDSCLASPETRHSNWCINIPALLRSNKKNRRRSDPSSLKSSSSSLSSLSSSRHSVSSSQKLLSRSSFRSSRAYNMSTTDLAKDDRRSTVTLRSYSRY